MPRKLKVDLSKPFLRLELQDDWCRAWVNGKLVAENHSIDVDSFEFELIADALGIILEKSEVESEDEEFCGDVA